MHILDLQAVALSNLRTPSWERPLARLLYTRRTGLGAAFGYRFSSADGLSPNANYTLSLLFCELYFSAPAQRLFAVTANGKQMLLQLFDVYTTAGM